MATNKKGYMKQYVSRLRSRALGIFNNRCASCFCSDNLQFAHRKKNGVSGRGRGRIDRIRNVISNINDYILLCGECHREFDTEYNGELKL